MTGRTFTVELTDEQLVMVEMLAADHMGHSVPQIVQHAMNDGLDMMFQAHTTPPAPEIDWSKSRSGDLDDDIPF